MAIDASRALAGRIGPREMRFAGLARFLLQFRERTQAGQQSRFVENAIVGVTKRDLLAFAIDHSQILQPLVAEPADLKMKRVAAAPHIFERSLAGGASLLLDQFQEVTLHGGGQRKAVGYEHQLSVELLD